MLFNFIVIFKQLCQIRIFTYGFLVMCMSVAVMFTLNFQEQCCGVDSYKDFSDIIKHLNQICIFTYGFLTVCMSVTVMFNFNFQEQCCGVDSFKDFSEQNKDWPPKQIRNKTVDLQTPVMCCKIKSKDFSCAEKNKATKDNNWLNTVSINLKY